MQKNPYYRLASALVGTLLCCSPAMSQPHWQNPDYIVESVMTIALKNEYSPETSRVRKWASPILYNISDRTQDKSLHKKLTQTHLEHLVKITSHPINLAAKNQRSNLEIIFSSEEYLISDLSTHFQISSPSQLKHLSREGVCFGHFSINKASEITKAVVLIPVDRARANAKLLSCIVEELTQIMGLPNDSDQVFPSIFNDKSQDDFLSGLDYVLLKALYHPSVIAGMEPQQLKSTLQTLLMTDEFTNLIEQAELVVRQQGLYPLLN